MAKRINNKQISVLSNFDYNNNKGVNLAMPLLSTDAANKAYVDNVGTFFVPRNLVNGSFAEHFSAIASSIGGNIILTLVSDLGGDLTMQFSTGTENFDCTPPQTIILTQGTKSIPVSNYVYIPISTKILTLSTTGWPNEEHIKVSYSLLQSVDDFDFHGGALVRQNINDGLSDISGQGHLTHITERLRISGAQWFSGIDGAGENNYLTIDNSNSPNDVHIKMTAGVVYQLHKHVFSGIDTSAGDHVHIVNDPTTPYLITNNLNVITTNALGNSLNGRYFNIVLWGVSNNTGEHSLVMVNLPNGDYNNANQAKRDLNGYDNFSMPREFTKESSTGFLIARITLRYTNNGTYTYNSTVDLRGLNPLTAKGGSVGSDVSTEIPDSLFKLYDDIDPTKEVQFQLSEVSSSSTSILSIPDESGVIITDATLGYTNSLSHIGLTNNPHNVTLSQLGIESTTPENGQILIYNSLSSKWENGNTINNDLTINGNLYVSGTTTTVNSADMSISDNIIVINKGELGNGVTLSQAGIEVDRGTYTNYQFIFDELEDTFKIGEIGNLSTVATREISPINGAFAYWDSATFMFKTKNVLVSDISDFPSVDNYNAWKLNVDGSDKGDIGSNENVNFVGGTNVSLAYSTTDNTITINSTAVASNNYLTDVSGSGNGIVTFTMEGLTDLTWDTSHTHNYDKYTSWNLFIDNSDKGNITSNKKINFVGGNAIGLVYSTTDDNTITINHTDTSTQETVTNTNGNVIQSISLDGYGHATSITSIDFDTRYLQLTGGTIDNGLNTSLTILSDEGGESILNLYGDTNGIGKIFLGENSSYGGGIKYVSGTTNDLTFYRLNNNISSWTAKNNNDNNNWEFREDITAGGDIIINGGDLTINNNNGGVSYNDVSKYWLKTATNYGMYWNTTDNQLEFHGGGVTNVFIDLDDGSSTFSGAITATSFIGNASSSSIWETARTITLDGDLSGNVSIDGSNDVTLTATVTDGSHSHDTQYYTKSIADTTFVSITGDTMTGALTTRDYVEVQDTGGEEGFKMQWNDIDKTIDFIFN